MSEASVSRNPRSSSVPRFAGAGIIVYALATIAGFMFSGSPGGDYSAADVSSYIAPSHAPAALVLWYVTALGTLALVVFGAGVRSLPGIGGPLSALATIGAALGVTGAWLAGGVDVAMVEGGGAVRSGVPAPVVYVLTEIGHALAACGPAMCVGIIGIVLAVRGAMPVWLAVLSVIGGLCGILAPFFFTAFVYLLWVLVLGVALLAGAGARRGARTAAAKPASSLV
jgi:hypothetical protein